MEGQGKTLTTNIPEVEASDNLGGDRKEREFRWHQEQGTSDVVGRSSRSGSSRTRTPGTKLPRPCQIKHPKSMDHLHKQPGKAEPKPLRRAELRKTQHRNKWEEFGCDPLEFQRLHLPAGDGWTLFIAGFIFIAVKRCQGCKFGLQLPAAGL